MNFAYRLLTKSKETYKTHKSPLKHHWQVSNRSNVSFGMTVRVKVYLLCNVSL
jgi:lipopolysaccharide/colanic/teichoic acid biosynthesis glycosyltransferase